MAMTIGVGNPPNRAALDGLLLTDSLGTGAGGRSPTGDGAGALLTQAYETENNKVSKLLENIYFL